MAKRFTDSEKWTKKLWFKKLPPKMKLVWFYLCDMCDHAGLWEADFDLMKASIGDEVTPEEIENAFPGRVLRLPGRDADKYLLLGFIAFQYKKWTPGNKTHESAKRLLRVAAPHIDAESLVEYPKPYLTLSIPHDNPSLTPSEISEALSGILHRDKEREKDKDKDTDKDPEGFKKPCFNILEGA